MSKALKTIGLVILYGIVVIVASVLAVIVLAAVMLAIASPLILIVWLILGAMR